MPRPPHINFYPRSPCGERPIGAITYVVMTPDFYPRSPCGERQYRCQGKHCRYHHFYPRSPCGERPAGNKAGAESFKFLSTLSLRRATQRYHRQAADRGYFYPRSPCGERPPFSPSGRMTRPYFYPRSPCGERLFMGWIFRVHLCISIHALLAESDHLYDDITGLDFVISIHALLAESDMTHTL